MKIDNVEKDVLDTKYENFNLIYRKQDEALPHLLKIVGDYWREERNDLSKSNFMSSAHLELTISGLEYCIRWIISSPGKHIKLPKANNFNLDREASDLLIWGTQYHMLVLDHVAYRKKLIQARIDEANKTIEFMPTTNFSKRFLLAQSIDSRTSLSTLFSGLPLDAIKADFTLWKNHLKFYETGIDSTINASKLIQAYPAILEWLESFVLTEIDPMDSLGDYTLDDFRKFFAALFLHCTYWTWIEDDTDRLLGDEHFLGTLILNLKEGEMIEWLHSISEVSLKSLKSILRDFTLNIAHRNSRLANQPFVKSSRGIIYLLPRLFVSVDPLRMLSGSLLYNPNGRKIYERIIETISSAQLSKIPAIFKGQEFVVWQEKEFVDISGRIYTPDLIVFDKAHNQLLISDYKHSLSPFSIGEVLNKLDRFAKDIGQVQRYIKAAKNTSDWIKEYSKNSIIGLLVYRYPMPLAVTLDKDIVVTNLLSLENSFSSQRADSLADLVLSLQNRLDLSNELEDLMLIPMEIQVDEWKYIRYYVGK